MLRRSGVDVSIRADGYDQHIRILLRSKDGAGRVAAVAHARDERLPSPHRAGSSVIGVAENGGYGRNEQGLAICGKIDAVVKLVRKNYQ